MAPSWEVALAGTGVGIFGGWLMKATDKCKCYIIKPVNIEDNNSLCCCCNMYECGIGFTKKPLRPDGDDTELKITELNGVEIAYVNKRGNFVHDTEGSDHEQ